VGSGSSAGFGPDQAGGVRNGWLRLALSSFLGEPGSSCCDGCFAFACAWLLPGSLALESRPASRQGGREPH